MPRVRLLLELPDLSDVPTDHPASVVSRLVAAASRPGQPGVPGQQVTFSVGADTFAGELLGVEAYQPTEGLVLNATSEHDLDFAWEELHRLAREFLSAEYDDFPNGVTIGALNRIISGVESVYFVNEGRFATTEERRRVIRGLNVWERTAPTA